jgi:hypothetical protein
MARSGAGESVLSRAVRIFEAFTPDETTLGVPEIVGQHVARLEAEALVTALARRVAAIELTGLPVRHLNNTLRAFKSLPVRLHLP